MASVLQLMVTNIHCLVSLITFSILLAHTPTYCGIIIANGPNILRLDNFVMMLIMRTVLYVTYVCPVHQTLTPHQPAAVWRGYCTPFYHNDY